jgi:thioredoxin reductase (NADPH)
MPESHAAVIIIGSGSAGLTAALYAARANLAPLVFEGKEPGGQLTLTTSVDNFPGFPDGIQGPDLMDLMRNQAQRFGAQTRWETVFEVDLAGRPFRVRTTDDPSGDPSSGTLRDYTAAGLIVATGASARWLGIEGPYLGNGVSTCATCDGALYRGKEIAVVGGGDSAIEEATFLTRFATKVTLIHRREALRASKVMQDRLRSNSKIEPAWNSVVEQVRGEKHGSVDVLTGVKLKSTKDGSSRDLKIDGLFLAIGHVPNTAVFNGKLAMTPEGYLLTRTALAWKNVVSPAGLLDSLPNYGTATSVEGVFACGDVVDTHYRQAITAAGSGCAAAMDCEKWLEATGAAH